MGGEIIQSLQMGNTWFEERQGGLARVYYELLRHLPAVGVEVRGLVVGSKHIEERSPGTVRGFAPADLPIILRLYAARQGVAQMLSASRFDLVASHFALYTAPVLSMIRHLPLIVHFHGPWASESTVEGAGAIRSIIQNAIESSVYKRAERLIVLSRAFEKELIEHYRIPERFIRVVPAGVDIDHFHFDRTKQQAKEKLGWPVDRPTVLAIRRLVPRMGLEDLIDATRELIVKNPEVQVMLGGTGPLATKLQQRVDDYGLRNHFLLLGRIDDELLPMAYSAADLSIVPSVSLEGFGMITLESLACGTPVLVTPIGGLPEVVEGLAPELVLQGTGAHFIARGLSDALRGEMRLPSDVECRAYAVSRFTWPMIAEQTRQVYLESLA